MLKFRNSCPLIHRQGGYNPGFVISYKPSQQSLSDGTIIQLPFLHPAALDHATSALVFLLFFCHLCHTGRGALQTGGGPSWQHDLPI